MRTPKSILWKVAAIVFISLLLLIPTGLIMELIEEREKRQQEARADIQSAWADQQTITGPILKIPYTVIGTKSPVRGVLTVLPEDFKAQATLFPQIRRRGIFSTPIYTSSVGIQGVFPALSALENTGNKQFHLDKATIVIGISDNRGLEEKPVIRLGSARYTLVGGKKYSSAEHKGISSIAAIASVDTSTPFNVTLKLRGSEGLLITPVGNNSEVTMQSTWPSPGFSGAYLPHRRTQGSDGFSAEWKVTDINRDYPQSWINDSHYNIDASAFGTKLVQTVDNYSQSYRSVRYAIVVIALTFAAFFFVEVLREVAIHPMQYIFVGVALVIYYTLLLSISEHTSFAIAYAAASAATTLLITGYMSAILSSWKKGATMGAALSAIYLFIYILMVLEDFALLLGSAGLFCTLAMAMYLSRRVDWYSVGGMRGILPRYGTDDESEAE